MFGKGEVSLAMVVPVIISLAQAAGFNPVPAALGATSGASGGFILPVSTPPKAFVYGSGMIPITNMIRAGFLFGICGGLVIQQGLLFLIARPFTSSISSGITIVFLSDVLIRVLSGKAKEVSLVMYILAVFFLVFFITNPVLK